jgi:hypothetical protein
LSRRKPRNPRAVQPPPTAVPDQNVPPPVQPARTPRWVLPVVVALLTVQLSLAVRSLVLENPTVDEVIHLPAGISYWQTGSFRLYHHNPPLVKLIAALPVLAGQPPSMRYSPQAWGEYPNKMAFAHEFMEDNARDYFELFTQARLVMPLFALAGGIVVYLWSARLYGFGGGLLSLTLWVFCPNVLAHCRLVTTDMGATSLGLVATYLFWRDLKKPSWPRAAAAGVALGVAELTKFSLILLYGLWPMLGLILLLAQGDRHTLARRLGRGIIRGAAICAISVLVIDTGYGFEGVGIPLGRYEFVCQSLTRPVPRGMWRPSPPDPILAPAYQHRVNRFRNTIFAAFRVPLPKHYLLGFDEQKLEAEGIPQTWFGDSSGGQNTDSDEVMGYPVYLDGVLRQTSWWYYYLLALVYKVPEGTWCLVLASLFILVMSPRSCAPWFDELTVLAIPAVVLGVMSVFTNINLGLRYVLPVFPYVYISVGKLVPWAAGLAGPRWRRRGAGFVVASALASVAATLSIAPHYLAYFNWVSGGPENGSAHLIDSNLDWGQDLVGLRRWVHEHAEGERIGLAYFGQIHPDIFRLRAEGPLDWFLPPPAPRAIRSSTGTLVDPPRRYRHGTEGMRLEPGLYAVSASLVRGLPWRVYDNEPPRWAPHQVWSGFGYFLALTPIAHVGHSILIYRVTPEDSARLGPVGSQGSPRL